MSDRSPKQTNQMIADKTITIEIVDGSWIVTVDQGKAKGYETKVFKIYRQFATYLKDLLEPQG